MSDFQLTFEELERLARSDGWVHGLAARLVGDTHLADDVVQEAYLVALAKPERPSGSLSAWLAGVIRNVARSRLREDGRRRHREESRAQAESVPAADVSAARLEQQGILIQHMLDLPEPYREALILRYVDGQAPRHLARRLDLPVATINSRLARGLERLRSGLDGTHGGDRSRWMSAFAPLLIPTSKTSPLTLGGLIVKHKLITAVALALLLVTGVAGFEAFRGPDATGLEPLSSEGQLAQAPALVDPGQPLDSGEERARVDREPASLVSADEIQGREHRLQLLNARSRDVLPGAKVYVLDSDELYRDRKAIAEMQRHHPWNMRELMRTAGRVYVADEEGKVTLLASGERTLVLAEWQGLLVASDLDEREERQVLLLGRDRQVSVRVIDEAGQRQVGIAVRMAIGLDQGMGQRMEIPVSASETGADGMTSLILPQEGLEFLDGGQPTVQLDLPLDVVVQQSIDLEAWPEGVIELVLPPVGAVNVHVTHQGQAVPDGTLVMLAKANESMGVQALFQNSGLQGKTVNGRVSLEPVGLEAELLIGSWVPECPDVEFVRVRGPSMAFGSTSVELELRRDIVQLQGRVLEEATGLPAKGPVMLSREDVLTVALTLDEDGRFEQVIGLLPEEDCLDLVRYGELGMVTDEVGLPMLRASEIDLGDLLLTSTGAPESETGPRIEGRVIDAEGKSVSRALLRWVVKGRDSGVWTSTGSRMSISQANGEFTLAGELPSPDAMVEVNSSRGWTDPLPLAPPAEGVVIQLREAASLVGRVLLDEGVSSRSLGIGLWSQEQGVAPSRLDVFGWKSVTLEEDRFRFQGLKPGLYTLRLEPDGARHAAWALQDIEVREEITRDARLDPIDLRGRLNALRLSVLDEAGQPLGAAVYAFRDGKPNYVGHTRRGSFTTSTDLPEAYVVELEGYFAQALDPLRMPEVVTLKRGLEVSLDWQGDRPLEDLDFRVQAKLSATQSEEVPGGRAVARYLELWSPGEGYLDEGVLRIPRAGEYQLRLFTSLEEPANVFWTREIEGDVPRFVQLDESEAAISVGLDNEAIEAETSWLKERLRR